MLLESLYLSIPRYTDHESRITNQESRTHAGFTAHPTAKTALMSR